MRAYSNRSISQANKIPVWANFFQTLQDKWIMQRQIKTRDARGGGNRRKGGRRPPGEELVYTHDRIFFFTFTPRARRGPLCGRAIKARLRGLRRLTAKTRYREPQSLQLLLRCPYFFSRCSFVLAALSFGSSSLGLFFDTLPFQFASDATNGFLVTRPFASRSGVWRMNAAPAKWLKKRPCFCTCTVAVFHFEGSLRGMIS